MNRPGEAGAAATGWLVGLLAVAVAGVCIFGLLRLQARHDQPETAAGSESTSQLSNSATTSTTPSTTPSTTTAATQPAPKLPPCVGPSDLTNVKGVDQDSLPADCGNTPVTGNQPLGLACGGKFPVIMFKTTTAESKASICGQDTSGESNYMVVKPNGGAAIDMSAEYAPALDAFVGKKDGVKYIVEAYNGSLTIKQSGSSHREVSKDWISLDNESDYD